MKYTSNIMNIDMKYKILIRLSVVFSFLFVASIASAATFSLTPASASYNVGDTFTVDVNLNTTGASIDGVDIRYLRFNPALLQVVDANTSVAGVQITAGNLMPFTPTNTVDNSQGVITFSQIVVGGQKYQGSGTLMSIKFKALGAGNSTVSFDATPGNTTDSNIASNGLDILSSASSGQFALVIGSGTPAGGTGAGAAGGAAAGSGSNPAVTTQISNFSAVPSNSKVVLTWTNPTDPSYVSTIIVRKQNNLPSSSTDGVQVYSGTGVSYTDTNIVNDSIYYYAAFSVLTTGVSPSASGSMYAVPRLVSTAPPTTVTTPNAVMLLTRTLIRGSVGLDVKLLQLFLITKGYLANGSAVSTFGPATERAVQAYQKAAGIASSGTPATTGYGMVGLRTRTAINAILPSLALNVGGAPTTSGSSSFTRDLSLGMTGADVMALQKLLNSKGFNISGSGAGSLGQETTTFGPATRAALIRYQASKGISATGYFGPLTRSSISQ